MLGRNVPIQARVTTPMRGVAAADGAERGTGEEEVEPVSEDFEGAPAVAGAPEGATAAGTPEGAADMSPTYL